MNIDSIGTFKLDNSFDRIVVLNRNSNSEKVFPTYRIGTDDLDVSSFALDKEDVFAFIIDYARLGDYSRMDCIVNG